MNKGVVCAFPKITADGKTRVWHPENKDWYLEEKLDGSQLSFCATKTGMAFYNRGKELNHNDPGWVFESVISALKTLREKLSPGYMYHGECIVKCKHNVICYGRVPKFYFVLFDVQDIQCGYFIWRDGVEREAHAIGVEVVQLLWKNDNPAIQPVEKIESLLDTFESMLGGDAPEGIVLKHPSYNKNAGQQSSPPKLSATKIKFVRDAFKEEHKRPNKKERIHPAVPLTPEQSLERIMSWFPKEPRWNKAKQRLRDVGAITGEPENAQKERNLIMAEARRDFKEECKDALKDLLWVEFGQRLTQSITDGMGQ